MSDKAKVDPRPVDAATGEPVGPLAQPGYYRGFSTLGQQKFWDARTREVVLNRVYQIPQIRFFSTREAALLKAICDRAVPQDDRDQDHKIPIVPQIDKRLYENSHDGYRYEDMPPDREAFRLGLQAIDEIAWHEHKQGFLEIGHRQQDQVLQSLHRGKPSAGQEIWKLMPAHRFWMMLLTACAEAYYSHPWAWDEIGFGGPAYPRAYMRLERGEAEPWEVEEKRYDWRPPDSSVSGQYEPLGGLTEHFGSPGHGGMH